MGARNNQVSHVWSQHSTLPFEHGVLKLAFLASRELRVAEKVTGCIVIQYDDGDCFIASAEAEERMCDDGLGRT